MAEVTTDEARTKLRAASFRVIIPEPPETYWGTGFFISEKLALTAYHNLPEAVLRKGFGFLEVYRDSGATTIPMIWRRELSIKRIDIAVLELAPGTNIPVNPVGLAFVDLPDEKRRNFLRAFRPVCIYGFPAQDPTWKERLIEGFIATDDPFGPVPERDSDGSTTVVERLRIAGTNTQDPEGISGGAVLDLKTGLVIGVDGSAYKPREPASWIYASELVELIRHSEELQTIAVKLSEPLFPGPLWQPPPPRLIEVGCLLNGFLRVIRPLGTGRQGTVFLVRDEKSREEFALKTFQFSNNPDSLRRRDSLLGEARKAAGLAHSGIARIHQPFDITRIDQSPPAGILIGVLMEFVAGLTLEGRRQDTVTEKLAILLEAAKALDYAHDHGVYHGNIKPSNIMVLHVRNVDHSVKVTDFGLPGGTNGGTTTESTDLIGTVGFMSLEQIRGEPLTRRSDQFALAIIAQQWLKDSLSYGFSPQIQLVFARASHDNPSRRFESCSKFIEALRRPLYRDELVDETATRRIRWWVGAGAGLFLLVLLLAMLAPRDKLGYVWIPAGSFLMGCDASDPNCNEDEQPRHQVTLTKGFWMSQTETTVAAYERFAKATGKPMPEAPDFNLNWEAKTHPIVNVNWNTAAEFCTWAGGRLPTEAEWEYAARAGQDGLAYPWGNTISRSNANYYGTQDDGASQAQDQWVNTAPVDSFKPNAWNLFNMSGNVREWTADWYDGHYYKSSKLADPSGPDTGSFRSVRGGAWRDEATLLRTAFRLGIVPEAIRTEVGFRCVTDKR